MKKNFYFNVLFLFLTGIIVKILGLVNRIIIIRLIGNEGVIIYTLITPTIMLFLALSQFGFPLSISALISKKNNKYSNREIIFKALFISLVVSVLLILVLFILIKPLSMLLGNDDIILPLLSLIPLIPMVAFNSILKGYFNGIGRYILSSNANLVEQVGRILATIFLIQTFIGIGTIKLVSLVVLSLAIGEGFSLIFLLLNVRSYDKIPLRTVIRRDNVLDDILHISIPSTSSRVIGNLTYFFEPIIYTLVLSYIGYSSGYINNTYTNIMGYALPLLTTSSFLSLSICTILIPEASKEYSKGNILGVHNFFNRCVILTFTIATFFTVISYFYSEELMQLLFNTTLGAEYVKLLALPFFFLYFQPIFTSLLQALGKGSIAFKESLIGSILKLILLGGLPFIFDIGENSILYALVISICYITFMHFISIIKLLKYEIKLSQIVFTIVYFSITFTIIGNIKPPFLTGVLITGILSVIPLLKTFKFKKRIILSKR